MSLLPRIRAELAGAWRSAGYDLGRRPAGPSLTGGPDVTSTGMNTFPGSLVDLPVSRPETDARPPRRFVAVTAFCALAAMGAGGSYVAATTVFAEEPAGVTQAAPGPDRADGSLIVPDEENGSDAMGRVPMSAGRPRTTAPAGDVARDTARRATAGPAGRGVATAPPVAVKPPPSAPAGRRTVVVPSRASGPASPECHCLTPPVPTPTSLPGGPAAPPSPSPSPAESSASPSPDPSRTPRETASPSPDAGRSSGAADRRDRRHHRHPAG